MSDVQARKWPSIALGEIAVKRRGSVDPQKFLDETFELYSIPAYDAGRPEIVKGAEIGSSKQLLEPEDVVISRIVPHIQRVWIIGSKTAYRQIGSGEWIAYRSKRLLPQYLRHALLSPSFHASFMATVAGVGGSLLRARPSAVAEIEISCPPLDEQRRIAAILDKADAIRRKRQQALALADDVLRSAFLEMFGDPVTNPKGFKQVELQTLCLNIVDCLHKTPEHSPEVTPFPSLRTSDLQNGYIDLSTTKYVDESGYRERVARLEPIAGDIIYSREGERFGIAALIPEGMTPCLGQRTMMFRIDPAKVTSEFFWAMLNSRALYGQAKRLVGGATSPHVNIGDIRKFIVLCPPIEIQNHFSNLATRIFAKRTRLRTFSRTAEQLFSSLSQRAFRGEL